MMPSKYTCAYSGALFCWVVQCVCANGDVQVTQFHGYDAKARAEEYQRWMVAKAMYARNFGVRDLMQVDSNTVH